MTPSFIYALSREMRPYFLLNTAFTKTKTEDPLDKQRKQYLYEIEKYLEKKILFLQRQ
jgi:hypothetical protein